MQDSPERREVAAERDSLDRTLEQDSHEAGSVDTAPSMRDRPSVQVLEAGDLSKARQTLSRAFHDYSVMKYAMDDSRRRLRGAEAIYGGILLDSFRHGLVMTTPGHAGVACWLPPGVGTMTFLRQWRAGMTSALFHFGLRGVHRLTAYEALHRRLHHEYAPEPHWYLAALGVAPERQGEGIGSALLKPMSERADREGVNSFLETQWERNVTLYARHGFEVVWSGKPKGHPVTTWAMLRRPR